MMSGRHALLHAHPERFESSECDCRSSACRFCDPLVGARAPVSIDGSPRAREVERRSPGALEGVAIDPSAGDAPAHEAANSRAKRAFNAAWPDGMARELTLAPVDVLAEARAILSRLEASAGPVRPWASLRAELVTRSFRDDLLALAGVVRAGEALLGHSVDDVTGVRSPRHVPAGRDRRRVLDAVVRARWTLSMLPSTAADAARSPNPMPSIYAPTWQVASPLSFQNVGDVDIPPCTVVSFKFGEPSGIYILPAGLVPPFALVTPSDPITYRVAGVTMQSIRAGQLGPVAGRPGDIVVVQLSGDPVTAGQHVSPYSSAPGLVKLESLTEAHQFGPRMIAPTSGVAGEYIEAQITSSGY